jgi:hypothetical protein
MKELIKKILREETEIPKWFREWEKLPREGRIAGIEERKKHILKLVPSIVDFFELKFSDYLEKIEVGGKKIHYGNELHSMESVLLKFYFNKRPPTTKHLDFEIRDDINGFFGIDITYYGIPLDIETIIKK